MNPLASGMTVGQALQWAQLMLSVFMLLGGAFTLGRIFERMGAMQKNQDEMKAALFGPDGQGGLFLRREEARLLLESANAQRTAQNIRIEDVVQRIAALEHREPA